MFTILLKSFVQGELMSFQKFAKTTVLAYTNDTSKGFGYSKTASIDKIASYYKEQPLGTIDVKAKLETVADTYKISKNPDDYVFVSVRALTANVPNENHDCFMEEELLRFDQKQGCKVYATFNLKPHHVNHRSSDPTQARGCIIDVHYNTKNAEHFPELLIAVDKTKDKKLAEGIASGELNSFSMGCSSGHTICSICGNKASVPSEFCTHISLYKGKEVEGKIAFEDCREVGFEEESSVDDPADKQALTQEVILASKGDNTSDMATETEFLKVNTKLNGLSSAVKTVIEQLKTREASVKTAATNDEVIKMFLNDSFPKDKMPEWGTPNLKIKKIGDKWGLVNFSTVMLYRDAGEVYSNITKYSSTSAAIQTKIKAIASDLGVTLKEVKEEDMPVKNASKIADEGYVPEWPEEEEVRGMYLVKSIWDNGGKSFDRYTIVFQDGSYLGLSHNPDSAQGFSQYDSPVKEGPNLGKEITWDKLPKEVREHVAEELTEIYKNKMSNKNASKTAGFDAEEIAETFINGNISDARKAIGNSIAKFNAVLSIIEEFNSSSVESFRRLMSKDASTNREAGTILEMLKKHLIDIHPEMANNEDIANKIKKATSLDDLEHVFIPGYLRKIIKEASAKTADAGKIEKLDSLQNEIRQLLDTKTDENYQKAKELVKEKDKLMSEVYEIKTAEGEELVEDASITKPYSAESPEDQDNQTKEEEDNQDDLEEYKKKKEDEANKSLSSEELGVVTTMADKKRAKGEETVWSSMNPVERRKIIIDTLFEKEDSSKKIVNEGYAAEKIDKFVNKSLPQLKETLHEITYNKLLSKLANKKIKSNGGTMSVNTSVTKEANPYLALKKKAVDNAAKEYWEKLQPGYGKDMTKDIKKKKLQALLEKKRAEKATDKLWKDVNKGNGNPPELWKTKGKGNPPKEFKNAASDKLWKDVNKGAGNAPAAWKNVTGKGNPPKEFKFAKLYQDIQAFPAGNMLVIAKAMRPIYIISNVSASAENKTASEATKLNPVAILRAIASKGLKVAMEEYKAKKLQALYPTVRKPSIVDNPGTDGLIRVKPTDSVEKGGDDDLSSVDRSKLKETNLSEDGKNDIKLANKKRADLQKLLDMIEEEQKKGTPDAEIYKLMETFTATEPNVASKKKHQGNKVNLDALANELLKGGISPNAVKDVLERIKKIEDREDREKIENEKIETPIKASISETTTSDLVNFSKTKPEATKPLTSGGGSDLAGVKRDIARADELYSGGKDDLDADELKKKVVTVKADKKIANEMTPEAQDFVSKKIEKLIGEGKPQDQAAAIAYSMAREEGYDVPEKTAAYVQEGERPDIIGIDEDTWKEILKVLDSTDEEKRIRKILQEDFELDASEIRQVLRYGKYRSKSASIRPRIIIDKKAIKAEIESEVKKAAAIEVASYKTAFRQRFLRSLKLANLRATKNLVDNPLKASMADVLFTPTKEYTGMDMEMANQLTEESFAKGSLDYINSIVAEAEKFIEMPEDSFLAIEDDTKKLNLVIPVADIESEVPGDFGSDEPMYEEEEITPMEAKAARFANANPIFKPSAVASTKWSHLKGVFTDWN